MANKAFRHKLLIYHRLGQRLRTIPLIVVLMAGLLLALGWLAENGFITFGSTELLELFWGNRILLVGLAGFSLLLYLLILVIANASYVEVRPKALRVRAGLLPQDISYGRINRVVTVGLEGQYPPDDLSGSEYALLKPFYGTTCTAVHLDSWPDAPLKKLWHPFMFLGHGEGLLLIVENAMVLNQQLDTALTHRHSRMKKRKSGYQDPIDRAQGR